MVTTRCCQVCGASLAKKPGPGRWPKWCPGECAREGTNARKRIAPEQRRKRGRPRTPGHERLHQGYVYVRVDGSEREWPTCHNGEVKRAHLVWNRAHPDDLVQRGEHVHHRKRRDDDRIGNLEKLTAEQHYARHHDDNVRRMRELHRSGLRALRGPGGRYVAQADEDG